jgi:hypothetical protein
MNKKPGRCEPTRRRAAKRVAGLRTSRGASRRVTCDSLPLTASIRASAAPIPTRLRFRPTHPRLLFLRYQHVCACTGRSSWLFPHAPRFRRGLIQCPRRPAPHSRHTCCMFVIVNLCAECPAETLIHESQCSPVMASIRKLRLTYRASVYLRRSSEVRVALVGKSQLPDVNDRVLWTNAEVVVAEFPPPDATHVCWQAA